ncbi:unnamed protein product [Auanema sp. JU1783]|nr:unnamed protein product [Auanema sp. JU1783]
MDRVYDLNSKSARQNTNLQTFLMSNNYMDDDDDDIICIEDSFIQPLRTVPPRKQESPRIENADQSFDRFLMETIEKANGKADEILKPKKAKSSSTHQTKEMKEKEKNEKKIAREKLKEEKEREKLKRKIEREISASANTKAEQYIYCHLGSSICSTIDDLSTQAQAVFLERKLENQLVIDDKIGNQIYWYRKCIELTEEDGKVEKFEYFSHQHIFAVFIEGSELERIVKTGKVEEFLLSKKEDYPLQSADCLILCYGPHNIQSKKMMELSIDVFERTNSQFHFFKTSAELSLFLAQVLRSLSKKVHTDSCSDKEMNIAVEKGIRDDDRSRVVKDWWDKMLQCLWRSSDIQRLAILKHMKNPFEASQKYRKMGYIEALQEISEIQCENGRRLGPAMAHRLLMVLTDSSGKEIAE